MADETGGSGQVDVLHVEVKAEANEQSLREMEQEVQQAGENAGAAGGGGIKGAIGGALAGLPAMAAAAGVAVGAALAAGLKVAVDTAGQARQGVVDLAAGLGITQEEATQLGEVAKRVFGNNWTGSLAEAQKAVENVRREVKGLSNEDLQLVAEGSVAIADRFEEEQQRVATAVQSVIQATGVGAQEALDIITAGFQRGLNSSGDFLDTLNEYGPQFEKAKIPAGQLFSLLESGAGKGALGTDKVADAFKEFGLTVVNVSDDTKAVYAELGLDQQKLVDQINAGSLTQAEAFQLVSDRLKGIKGQADQVRITQSIFAGGGEDMAALMNRLDITQTKLSDLAGTTQQVKDATNTLGSVFQTAWRSVQLQLIPVGDLLLDLANEAMPHVQAAIAKMGPVITSVVKFLTEGFKQGRESAGQFQPVIEKVGGVVQSLAPLFASVFGLVKTYWETILRPTIAAILPFIAPIFGGVADVVKSAIQTVTNIINAVSALLRGDWSKAWQFLVDAAWSAFGGLEKALDDMAGKLVDAGAKMGRNIAKGLRSGLDGLQSIILEALANAIDSIAAKAPDLLRPQLERLSNAAREGAERNAQTSAAARGYQGAGPSFTDRSEPTVQVINGKDLITLLGLAGRTQGAAYGAEYSFTRKDGGVHRGTHNGEDIFAPRGTPVLAPFSGVLTLGEDSANGKWFQVVDALGNRIKGLHLDAFQKGLEGAVREAGGKLFIEQGRRIGGVGDTGNLSEGNHLHLMAYDAAGKIINPLLAKFESMAAPRITDQPKVNTASTGGGSRAGAPTPTTVPIPVPDAAALKEYNFTLADWSKHQKEALALARELAKAEAAHNTVWAQQVTERIAGYTKDSQARAGAVEFAKKVLADQVALQEAAGKKEEETDLQRDQRLRREQQTRAALEESIRGAGEKRLNQIIQLGVTETNTLEKIGLAEAELERRGQLTTQRQAQAKAAREKAAEQELAAENKRRDEQSKREEAAEKEREARAKTIGTNRLVAERALAEGALTLAKGRAAAVVKGYDDEVKAAGSNAQTRLAVEKRLGDDVLAARNTLARVAAEGELARLKRDRNTAVNAEGLTLETRKKLWAQHSEKIAQVDTDLQTTLKGNAAESGRVLAAAQKGVTDAEKAESVKRGQQQQATYAIARAVQGQNLQLAEGGIKKLRELREGELREAGSNAQERLRVEQKYAADEKKALLDTAELRKKLADQAARSGPEQLRKGALALAQDRYDADVREANGLGRVAAAQETVSAKVQALRDQYSQLAESIRGQVAEGKFDEEAKKKAATAFDKLGEAATNAGVSGNSFLAVSRNTVSSLLGTGEAASQAAIDLRDQAAAVDELVDAEIRHVEARHRDTQGATDNAYRLTYGAGDVGLIRSLADTTGLSIAQVRADVEGALADAKRFAGDTAAVIERVYADALTHRRELGVVEREEAEATAKSDQQNYDETRKFILDTLKTRTDKGLLRVYDDAAATRDAALIAAVTAEWERRAQDAAQKQRDYFQGLSQNAPQQEIDVSGSQNMALPGVKPFDYQSAVGQVLLQEEREAATKKLREELERLGDAELQTARAQAIAGDDAVRLTAIITEQQRRVEAATQAQRDYYQSLPAGTFDLDVSGSQNMLLPDMQEADNYFEKWSKDIWAMGDALKDPLRLDQLSQDLEGAYKNGKLTRTELDLLRAIIASLNAEPLEPFQTDLEKRFDGLVEQGDELVKSFERGETGAEDFATQAGSLSDRMERLAVAAANSNQPELAAQLRDTAVVLRNLIPPLAETEKQVVSLSEGVEGLADGFASLFNALGLEDFGKLSTSAGQLFKTFTDGKTALDAIRPAFKLSFGAGLSAVGGFLGLVGTGINLVGQIGDAILNLSPGFQAWKKHLLEVADAEKKVAQESVGMFKNPYASTLGQDAANREKLANAGFWQRAGWAIFGGAPEVMKDEAAKLKTVAAGIFSDLGQTISTTLETEFMNAFNSGDWSGVEAAFDKSVNGLVARLAIQAIIAQSGLEEKIKAYADARAKALEDGGITSKEQAELDGLIAGLQAEITRLKAEAQGILTGLPGAGAEGPTPESINALQQEVSRLREQYNAAATDAERERLRGEIEVKEKELARLNGQVGGAKGSLAALREEISVLQRQYDEATTDAERERLRGEIDAKQSELRRLEESTEAARRRAADVARQLASQVAETEAAIGEAAYRSGEETSQQHQARLLRQTTDRIERERQVALEAVQQQGEDEVLTAEQVAQQVAAINGQYDQQRRDALNQRRDELLADWSSAAGNSVVQALESQDLSKLGDEVQKQVFRGALTGFVQGLTSDIIRAQLAPVAAMIAAALGTADTADDAAAIAALKAQLAVTIPAVTTLTEQFMPIYKEFGFLGQVVEKSAAATERNTVATEVNSERLLTKLDVIVTQTALPPGLALAGSGNAYTDGFD